LEGWKFRPERENGDYMYYVIHTPYKKEEFTNPVTGKLIVRYKK
jgi:hypothetical protein